MGPKKNVDVDEKPKRGRKSKKELMESLNIQTFIKEKAKTDENLPEIKNIEINNHSQQNEIQEQIQSETNTVVLGEKPIKKRGRKPKGGKIIYQLPTNVSEKENKTNVILHLKCSLKDLQGNGKDNQLDAYAFNKNDLCYELLNNNNNNITITNFNGLQEDDASDIDEDYSVKDSNKEIWRKLKQLEHDLHFNNVTNKRSCCFWDTCEFDSPPIYLPQNYVNGTYHVYACFCSPQCAIAHLSSDRIDSSTRSERTQLFYNMYGKIYDYKKSFKPAPDPRYYLEKYYGNLTIKEYRSLFKNERLYLVVDKPLTRVMPELLEDNDEFILNNKIIPSNTSQIKARLQRKNQTKTSILNEKFGTTNALLE